MYRMLSKVTVATLLGCALCTPCVARGQSFEVLGTRAAGMGGAFVAVADDATAVYWNPAGLALGGSFFSLVIDGSQGEAETDNAGPAGRRSAGIIALTTLPLGLSYYRLSSTSLVPVVPSQPGAPAVSLQRLTTHNAGFTIVQSVTAHLALATTLKLVHGIAAAGVVPDGDRDDLLSEAGDLPDHSTNKFDADIGVMASFATIRAGVTVRNVAEPDFSTVNGEPLELKRQTRAGVAYLGVPRLIVAGDVDIERARGSLGDERNVAVGAEAHILPRGYVRSGFRFNTLSDEPGGHAPVYSLGGSVVTFRSLIVDGQVTFGSESGDRGWGIAARLVY
jgi:hypothetical protein